MPETVRGRRSLAQPLPRWKRKTGGFTRPRPREIARRRSGAGAFVKGASHSLRAPPSARLLLLLLGARPPSPDSSRTRNTRIRAVFRTFAPPGPCPLAGCTQPGLPAAFWPFGRAVPCTGPLLSLHGVAAPWQAGSLALAWTPAWKPFFARAGRSRRKDGPRRRRLHRSVARHAGRKPSPRRPVTDPARRRPQHLEDTAARACAPACPIVEPATLLTPDGATAYSGRPFRECRRRRAQLRSDRSPGRHAEAQHDGEGALP